MPTIMIIEDNAITREGLAVILKRHGHEVIELENGRQALELLMTGTRPDVILLDMLLPVLDGWKLLKRLKDTPAANIPIIITTGTILTSKWVDVLGCAGFVKKPVEEQELLSEFANVLGERGAP